MNELLLSHSAWNSVKLGVSSVVAYGFEDLSSIFGVANQCHVESMSDHSVRVESRAAVSITAFTHFPSMPPR
jgi:hypothetical protein